MTAFETFEANFGAPQYAPKIPEFNPITGTYKRPTNDQASDLQGRATEDYPTVFEDGDQFPAPVYVDESI